MGCDYFAFPAYWSLPSSFLGTQRRLSDARITFTCPIGLRDGLEVMAKREMTTPATIIRRALRLAMVEAGIALPDFAQAEGRDVVTAP